MEEFIQILESLSFNYLHTNQRKVLNIKLWSLYHVKSGNDFSRVRLLLGRAYPSYFFSEKMYSKLWVRFLQVAFSSRYDFSRYPDILVHEIFSAYLLSFIEFNSLLFLGQPLKNGLHLVWLLASCIRSRIYHWRSDSFPVFQFSQWNLLTFFCVSYSLATAQKLAFLWI